MARLSVDTEILREKAQVIKNKAEEIETATNSANDSFGALRDMESERLATILDVWDQLHRAIKENVAHLLETADDQVKAAVAFDEADHRK